MRKISLTAYMTVIALLAAGCLGAVDEGESGQDYDDATEDENVDELDDKSVQTDNGLQTWNGLLATNGLLGRNGLKVLNGLSVRNGLRVVNGVTVINGLATRNGLKTYNGRSVSCAGTSNCTGDPDGLLNSFTGLMRSDQGIEFAKYLVKCALPAYTSIRVRNYRGYLEQLDGSIGLAPEWLDQQCTTACEEKVSSCLLALTNRRGNHISLQMSSPLPAIGASRTSGYPYQEGAFFGNLFADPPVGYVALGAGYRLMALDRSCSQDGTDLICPIGPVGLMTQACSQTAVVGGVGTATTCRSSSRSWAYPVTTWRTDYSYTIRPGSSFIFPPY